MVDKSQEDTSKKIEEEKKKKEEELKKKLPVSEEEEKVETRGRKKGGHNKTKGKGVDFSALLGASKGLMEFGFEVLAVRKGKHWILTEKELDGYSKITDQLVVKYLPFIEKFGLEVAFLIWTGNIFLPRFKIDTQNKLKGKKEGNGKKIKNAE